MNLSQGNELALFSLAAEDTNKSATIAPYCLPIVRREAKVELVATICDRKAATPSAKSVNDSWQFRKVWGPNNFNSGTRAPRSGFPGGCSRRHTQL